MTAPFHTFFEGKRVLVTGAAGVKGSWLSLKLLEAGAQVVGLDIRGSDPHSNFFASGLQQRISHHRGDVTHLEPLLTLLEGVECVFHLAAVALVGVARRNPLETYRTNTLGTATVLEAIRRTPSVRHAVFITTDKVYRPRGGAPWVESDPLFAAGPYQVSKAAAEHIIADYHHTYLKPEGKRLAIGRAGNVLIGGDFHSSQRTAGAGRIFVDCYEALMEDRPPRIFCPSFTRPYTFGLDILSGYMSLMSQLETPGVDGEAFNFGPREVEGIESAALAGRICALWGTGVGWEAGSKRAEPFDKQSLAWDKAQRVLGWAPAYSLEQALKATTAWYRAWARERTTPEEGALHALNLEQIQAHQAVAAAQGIRWAAGDKG